MLQILILLQQTNVLVIKIHEVAFYYCNNYKSNKVAILNRGIAL